MSILNKIKMIFSKESSKKSSADFQNLLSQCDVELSKLREELDAAIELNKELQESLDSKKSEIVAHLNEIAELRHKLNEQADKLNEERTANDELRHRNLNIQDENELLVGKSSNTVSKLIRFCQLLKTMDFSSVDECISVIKSEIEKSTSDLGFDIVYTCDSEFNPQNHRIVDTKETDDILLNNHIADVVRPGIWYEGKCLIPQDVIIYTVNK